MSRKEILRLPKRFLKKNSSLSNGNSNSKKDQSFTSKVLKSKKTLLNFYSDKVSSQRFTREQQSRIDESLRTELKKHRPAFFREIKDDPQNIAKSIKRKIEEQFWTTNQDEQEERNHIVA